MGITAIKGLINNSNAPVTLQDYENPSAGGNNITVPSPPPGALGPCYMWIPWCTSQNDFNHNHYIMLIGAELGATYYIWQDGDFVRYSREPAYTPNGPHVPGYAPVNGDRIVSVNPQGLFFYQIQ